MLIKLNTKIDINEMQNYLKFVQSKFQPYMKRHWGGWSITSPTGDVYDGWQSGEKLYEPHISEDEKNRIIDFFANNTFDKPTQIYNDYIASIIELIGKELTDIKLSRLRVTRLVPHPEEESYWHKDGDQDLYYRLHIPIVTNDQCFFEYKNQSLNLPADGSIFVVEVTQPHRALNLSTSDRYHLIADMIKRPASK